MTMTGFVFLLWVGSLRYELTFVGRWGYVFASEGCYMAGFDETPSKFTDISATKHDFPARFWFHGSTSTGHRTPLWLPLAAIAIPMLLLCRSSRWPIGRCQKCGYDLTGNVSGVCPECGTAAGNRKRTNSANNC